MLSIGFGEYLHLDWQQLADRIQIANIAGFFTDPVAQSMLAGLLALYRGLDQLAVLKEVKQWVGDPLRGGFKPLDGANVVLFGYGAINRRFEELIQPFGCQTVCLSSKTGLDDLDQALPSADVVVSTVPDTPSTQNVFNSSRLELLKKTAIFINSFKSKVLAQAPLDAKYKGHFVQPTIIEIKDLKEINKEIFGPVIHVYRYYADKIEELVRDINSMNYGLTLGIQSRIENTINYIFDNASIGNVYINRNIVGAVVGVQPFGGRGLSGTGPKTGGPNYLMQFVNEKTFTYNTTAAGGNASLMMLEENK